MAQRTTLVLDSVSLEAVRELAAHFQISQSEAIRRAVVAQRDQLRGTSAPSRMRKRKILEELFVLFENNDPVSETQRLKEEDS